MTPRRPHQAKVIELPPTHHEPPGPPRPRPGRPTCPSWMPKDGRAEWRRVLPELELMGLALRADRATLAGYCASYARWVEAERLISADGVIVDGYRGGRVKHPAAQIARDSRASMLVFARELGLTPRSREGISLTGPELVDDDDDGDLFDT